MLSWLAVDFDLKDLAFGSLGDEFARKKARMKSMK